MQTRIDTQGYIIRGLRKAVRDIKTCVLARELYFVYYDLATREVTVNKPAGYSATKICIIESGVYNLTQQELAYLVVDRLKNV